MNELTTQECLRVAEELADLGCRRVSLIGGEVFMRPDWAIIAGALTEKNIKVSIITNGYIFSDRILSSLKSVPIESAAVSVDGPESIHDRYRQKGSFTRAIQAIDLLSENDIPVSIITTLHSDNYLHLEELYEFIKEKKIYSWQLQACSPMGNAVRSGISSLTDYSYVIQFVEDHLDGSPFSIGIADNIGYYTASEGSLRGKADGSTFFLGCRAGLSTLGIDSVGNVRGCESMYDDSFIEGNLREKSLSEIWNDPNAFSYNRQFKSEYLSGKCSNCRYGRVCAGGCRSYNYFSHRKMYESPHCAIREQTS